MTRTVSRRSTLQLGAAAAAAPLLSKAALAQARTRLRMTWWGGIDRAKRTQAALDADQKQNAALQIDVETIGWGDCWTRLATQVAGGNAPDAIQMDCRYIYEYARRKALPVVDAEIYTYAHVVYLKERQDARLVHAFLTVLRDLLPHPTRGRR